MQLSDVKKAMKGVDIVQATPFNKDSSLDLEGMRANTRWLLERTAGKDFIFTPMGSTGEFYAVSDDERKAVIKMVVEEVNGENVVLAGGAQAGTPETIKMCQYAESVGADAVQIVLPYYNIPTEEGMYQHYKRVAESINIGIMVYNNPGVSGSWINPSLMARISKIPNIIAVKENTPYIMSYHAMQRAIDPSDMAILCGLGEQMFVFEALYGCVGFVSALANYAPDLAYSIYEAGAARDFSKLTGLIDSIAPISNFNAKIKGRYGPSTGVGGAGGSMGGAVLKASMDIVGLRGGEVRLPMRGISEEEKSELRVILGNVIDVK